MFTRHPNDKSRAVALAAAAAALCLTALSPSARAWGPQPAAEAWYIVGDSEAYTSPGYQTDHEWYYENPVFWENYVMNWPWQGEAGATYGQEQAILSTSPLEYAVSTSAGSYYTTYGTGVRVTLGSLIQSTYAFTLDEPTLVTMSWVLSGGPTSGAGPYDWGNSASDLVFTDGNGDDWYHVSSGTSNSELVTGGFSAVLDPGGYEVDTYCWSGVEGYVYTGTNAQYGVGSFAYVNWTIQFEDPTTFAPVPEPTSAGVVAVGGGLAVLARRRRA